MIIGGLRIYNSLNLAINKAERTRGVNKGKFNSRIERVDELREIK